MTKKLKKLWMPLFIGILIFTAACNKDNEDEPEQTVLLTKVTWSNTKQSGESSYEYDSQNRLISITENNNETITLYNISYNSNGTVNERVRSENGVESSKTLYTITNSLITMVFRNKIDGQWVDGPKTEYTLDASGKITKMQSFYMVDGNYVSDSYQMQNWQGGNIVKQETWGIQDNKINSILTEFDDSKNPYANFGILSGLNGYFNNNIKKTTINNPANENIITFTYSFEYNDYNYPSKRWQSKTNEEDTSDPIVYFYEYTIREN